MPKLTEQELKAKIKTNFSDSYLIYGEETYLTKIYVEKIIKASVDDSFADFNLHIFESEDTDLSTIYESAMAIPMMAETKCVVVKEFPVSECEDDDLNALDLLLQDNPDDNTLIFVYPTVQPKGKNFNTMVKLFENHGCVVNFEKKTVSDLAKVLESGAKKRDKTFAPGVSEYLVNNVGMEMNLLLNELDKLCAYVDDVIQRSHVDEICTKRLEEKVFEMIKDLMAGRFDPAFHKLSNLFERREDEYLILGALISQYADIYRAKAAVKSGEGAHALSLYYPSYKKNDFRINKAVQASNSFTFEQLSESLEILAKADEEMKGSSLDNKRILEQTIVKLVRAGRKQ